MEKLITNWALVMFALMVIILIGFSSMSAKGVIDEKQSTKTNVMCTIDEKRTYVTLVNKVSVRHYEITVHVEDAPELTDTISITSEEYEAFEENNSINCIMSEKKGKLLYLALDNK